MQTRTVTLRSATECPKNCLTLLLFHSNFALQYLNDPGTPTEETGRNDLALTAYISDSCRDAAGVLCCLFNAGLEYMAFKWGGAVPLLFVNSITGRDSLFCLLPLLVPCCRENTMELHSFFQVPFHLAYDLQLSHCLLCSSTCCFITKSENHILHANSNKRRGWVFF